MFTDDNWVTAKNALGEIQYTHPLTNQIINKYGLITDTVISGTLIGNDIIGGDIYSSNYKNVNGVITGNHLGLVNSNFELADGKIIYTNNTLTLKGVTIEWNTSTTPEISDIDGLSNNCLLYTSPSPRDS